VRIMPPTLLGRFPLIGTLLLLGAVLPGCDKPRAMGSANNIVAGVPDPIWAALEPSVREALEPQTFTVRDERVFDVAQVDPSTADWSNLRLVRQVLLVGEPGDPWVAEALDQVRGAAPAPPAVVQARNVWAQNQLVTILLLPPGGGAAEAEPLLPQVGETFLRQFEEYARARMFVTGADSALADSLHRTAGFSLVLPRVYYHDHVRPELWVARNDFPDPSQLIRSIYVASRPSGEVQMAPEFARQWRAELAQELTQPAQVTEPTLAHAAQVQVDGRTAVQVQGIWSNPPGEWPAAGPFITRLIPCGDRTFLVDAWLYAPGRGKYEYMFQLKSILDSFRCGS
jgi:hypothetical protein